MSIQNDNHLVGDKVSSLTDKISETIKSITNEVSDDNDKKYHKNNPLNPNHQARRRVDDVGDEVLISVDLPNVSGEDVNLKLKETHAEVTSYYGRTKYDLDVPISPPIDIESGTATFNNGVLNIRVNKM